jgi:hypothetical protein
MHKNNWNYHYLEKVHFLIFGQFLTVALSLLYILATETG